MYKFTTFYNSTLKDSVLAYIISDPFLASKAVCSIVDNDLLKSDI